MLRTVVIPIAGSATRMRPWSIAAAKAWLPVLQRGAGGSLAPRAVLDVLLHDALHAESGFEHACLVISPSQRASVLSWLASQCALDGRVSVVVQPAPAGFGDAVLHAEPVVGKDAAFAVSLGDYLYSAEGASSGGHRCFAELHRAYAALEPGAALITAGACALAEVKAMGLVQLAPTREGGGPHRVTAMLEKPGASVTAAQLSRFASARGGGFACNFGIDILPSVATFAALRRGKERLREGESELGLRETQAEMARAGKLFALDMCGYQHHDVGNPEAYWTALQHFATERWA